MTCHKKEDCSWPAPTELCRRNRQGCNYTKCLFSNLVLTCWARQVPISAGTHTVRLKFVGTHRLWTSLLASALAWPGLGIWLVGGRRGSWAEKAARLKQALRQAVFPPGASGGGRGVNYRTLLAMILLKEHGAGLHERMDSPCDASPWRGPGELRCGFKPRVFARRHSDSRLPAPGPHCCGSGQRTLRRVAEADLRAVDRRQILPQPGALPGSCSASSPAKLLLTSAQSAEIIKHASNSFLALKISFINAVANLAEAVDADIEEIAAGIGLDSRIGPKFLRAGLGYGGSCFPKDVAAFHWVAQQKGVDFQLLQEIHKINETQKEIFFNKVLAALWTLRGKKLAALGLAFKGGTDDIRESPAIDVIRKLLDAGASVTAYDPAAMEPPRCFRPRRRCTMPMASTKRQRMRTRC